MSSMHDLFASALALPIDAQPMFIHPVLANSIIFFVLHKILSQNFLVVIMLLLVILKSFICAKFELIKFIIYEIKSI